MFLNCLQSSTEFKVVIFLLNHFHFNLCKDQELSVILRLHPRRVWVFDNVFVYDVIWVCKPCKNMHAQVESPQYPYGMGWYRILRSCGLWSHGPWHLPNCIAHFEDFWSSLLEVVWNTIWWMPRTMWAIKIDNYTRQGPRGRTLHAMYELTQV